MSALKYQFGLFSPDHGPSSYLAAARGFLTGDGSIRWPSWVSRLTERSAQLHDYSCNLLATNKLNCRYSLHKLVICGAFGMRKLPLPLHCLAN